MDVARARHRSATDEAAAAAASSASSPGPTRLLAPTIIGLVTIGAAMSIDGATAERIRAMNLSPAAKSMLRVVRMPGDYWFTFVLAALIVLRNRRRLPFAVRLLLVTAVVSALAALLKWCIGRHRPFRGTSPFDFTPFSPLTAATRYGANLGFPSGDSALAFATAVMIAGAFPRFRHVAFGWAVLVAMARVLQGAHFPADAAAGALLGWLTAQILAPMLAHQPRLQDLPRAGEIAGPLA